MPPSIRTMGFSAGLVGRAEERDQATEPGEKGMVNKENTERVRDALYR